MKIGTKSILYGAHCWAIHPWFVALAWWKLYGFPRDLRLWVAFFVHDLGYWGKPNMDGAEGEAHVELGAALMHRWFDGPQESCAVYRTLGQSQLKLLSEMEARGYRFKESGGIVNGKHLIRFAKGSTKWRDLSLYHSRFYSKRDRKPFSRLCVADKLAVALEPWWLYLPRVIATGEIKEYMDRAGGAPGSKYTGEPKCTDPNSLGGLSPRRAWHKRMTNYCRAWALEHRDCKPDTWTPEQRAA